MVKNQIVDWSTAGNITVDSGVYLWKFSAYILKVNLSENH
jgi:hypothetical protein